jgi:hypothetical protein
VGSAISVGTVIVVSSSSSVAVSTNQPLTQRSVVDLYNVQPLLGGQDTLQLWHPRVSTRMPSIRAHAGLNVSLHCLHCPRHYQRDWGTQVRHAAGHQPFLESVLPLGLRWKHFSSSCV